MDDKQIISPSKDKPSETITSPGLPELSDTEIVRLLNGYLQEAENGRENGNGAREDVWEENIDLYWSRFDFSDKAEWQATEVLPEAPQFVNRFAGAMADALNKDGEFYTVTDPTDPNNTLAEAIKKMMNYWLSRCGRNATGHPVEFGSPFEDCMKLAAMMASCAAVTVKERGGVKYVAFDPVDPRQIWLDPTGRGLYRIKETIIDKHELESLVNMKDSSNGNIYNVEAIEGLVAQIELEEQKERERLAGHTSDVTTGRKPVVLHEYLCDLVDSQGNVRSTNYLYVVANKNWLIRGGEKNPWWHGKDWIVYTPAITVPLSVYGKTYMEDWSKLARTFNEMTNLILDAVHTNSMNAFVARPTGLEDPSQLDDGIHPNITLYADDGEEIDNILQSIELGRLPAEAVTMWQALKKELQEGALFSEIALGQLSRGEKTATEISESQQGSSGTLKSLAKNQETNFLEPVLELVWKTGLQHLSKQDKDMRDVVGPEIFDMFLSRKEEFVKKKIGFRVQAISGLIERNEKFKKLMSVLQIVASNELLLKTFVENTDMTQVLNKIFELNGLNIEELKPTPQSAQASSLVQELTNRGDREAEARQNQPPTVRPDEIIKNLSGALPGLKGGTNGGAGK